jgi:hypothetical protein
MYCRHSRYRRHYTLADGADVADSGEKALTVGMADTPNMAAGMVVPTGKADIYS